MGIGDLLREADALLDGVPDDATWYVPCDGCGEFTELRAGDRDLIRATQYGMEIDPAFVRFAPRAPHLLRAMRDALRDMMGDEV